MPPPAIARCAAAITGAGVGKSGSPISMWTTDAPGGLERARGRLHLHHVERRDLGDARRQLCMRDIHRKS